MCLGHATHLYARCAAQVLPADSSGASSSRVADRLRAVLDALKAALGGPAAAPLVSEIESLKFTSNGFFWDEAYARDRLAATLCGAAPEPAAGAPTCQPLCFCWSLTC